MIVTRMALTSTTPPGNKRVASGVGGSDPALPAATAALGDGNDVPARLTGGPEGGRDETVGAGTGLMGGAAGAPAGGTEERRAG